MVKTSDLKLQFTHTNEGLDAIIVGLEPNQRDRILAVAGSGDQAFALLESGAEVVVVDSSPDQIEFVSRRTRALTEGQDVSFLTVDAFGSCDGVYDGRQDYGRRIQNLKKRREYFEKPGRLDTIRANLSRLIILPKTSVHAAPVFRNTGINKAYLSNALFYNPLEMGPETVRKSLQDLRDSLPTEGLVYVANHSDMCARLGPFADFALSLLRIKLGISHGESTFLPKGLVLDMPRTRAVRKEYGWDKVFQPAVYRKVA